tara:strand:+ start:512 stop:934 length:423 start_codon:yes stop_codon:yes gene_type:complete
MNILILQGPNLNLLGLKSSRKESRLTLGKLNKQIRGFSKDSEISIKTLQTHKQFQAINFLQRNRNWANGILFIPTSWARNSYTILETINLIQLKTSVIYFNDDFSFGTSMEDSIFTHNNIESFTGSPIEACIQGMEFLVK